MSTIYNDQPRLGVRIVADGTIMFNGLPVIGISDESTSFVRNLKTMGVDVLGADAAVYNDQPVRGVVQISDGRVLYNGILVVPTTGGGFSASAPVNTGAPSIAGTPQQGQTLIVSNGTWSGYPAPTFAYQWKRGGVAISGATSQSYTLVSGDVGSNITCTVTATNASGSTPATSPAVGPVTPFP